MNIIVKTSSGHCLVRPDTTWERDNENLYLPEFSSRTGFTPVIYSKICKSGRSVGKKFAARYYDDSGFGVLLYPEELIDGSPEGFAQASCTDHTSFMTLPASGSVPFEGGSRFTLEVAGSETFSCSGIDRSVIEDAICEASKYIYLRTGDIIAVELAPRMTVTIEEGKIRFLGRLNENIVTDFEIIK